MKTALVTGAAGFIGRHMSRALIAAGYHVTAIDSANGGADARDFFRSESHRYDAVVHAAAVVGGRQVIDGSPLAQAVNLELDAALFAWAARTRPGRVVYLSSSAAYPVDLQDGKNPWPLRERQLSLSDPWKPDQLYGWCKVTGERLAVLARSEGVPVSVARTFSGYGEDQADDYPFPAIAARARRREDPLHIWGPGNQVRDWVHVDDVCGALMAMITEGIDGPVNIGTGQATSFCELASLMAGAAGYRPVIEPLKDKPAGVMYRVADTGALRKFYEPKVSLEDGVARIMQTERV